MVNSYKKEEEKHYDVKAQNRQHNKLSYADYVLKSSTEFYYRLVQEELSKKLDSKILDFGCGSGEKHFQFAKSNSHIVGIDISSKSVEKANLQVKEQNLNAEYLVMDCENMTFPDSTFDMILDFGTFSSLNIEIAANELRRVMKKDGTMICIETYGHNPFMKVKRLINVLFNKRTKWAAQHIMKKQNWELISNHFEVTKIYYFHFLVLFVPLIFRILPKSKRDKILLFVESLDSKILEIKLLQVFAFKTVVVCNNPKK
jgi:ubiquinone/menaquinone biosynthesis C-methylase UbiE